MTRGQIKNMLKGYGLDKKIDNDTLESIVVRIDEEMDNIADHFLSRGYERGFDTGYNEGYEAGYANAKESEEY